MQCRDRSCSPEKGDDGCMAHFCNVGAVDGMDGVWISAWDDCPLAEAERKAMDAERHEFRQQDAWEADVLSDLDSTGAA